MSVRQVSVANPEKNTGNIECNLLKSLAQVAHQAGGPDPHTVTNFYVSLKSKPLALVVGPRGTGKREFVRQFARLLTSDDPLRFLTVGGHAWWAAKSGNTAFFTEIQTRFIMAKALAVIEEASQPQNRNRFFILCLEQISPAELFGFFTELAEQLNSGLVNHLPMTSRIEPLLFLRNVLVIGTMDTDQFVWSDETLLSQTSVVFWPGGSTGQDIGAVPDELRIKDRERHLLRAMIRSDVAAHAKLSRVFSPDELPHQFFALLDGLLKSHNPHISEAWKRDILIYLANAWSETGEGLFAETPMANARIALDFALKQSLLLRLDDDNDIRRRPELRMLLCSALDGYERSSDFLSDVATN